MLKSWDQELVVFIHIEQRRKRAKNLLLPVKKNETKQFTVFKLAVMAETKTELFSGCLCFALRMAVDL